MLTKRIEQVQKRATKLVLSCKGLAYSERPGIPTLKYQQHGGDMIKFCMVYMTLLSPVLAICCDSVTRGNTWKT